MEVGYDVVTEMEETPSESASGFWRVYVLADQSSRQPFDVCTSL